MLQTEASSSVNVSTNGNLHTNVHESILFSHFKSKLGHYYIHT